MQCREADGFFAAGLYNKYGMRFQTTRWLGGCAGVHWRKCEAVQTFSLDYFRQSSSGYGYCWGEGGRRDTSKGCETRCQKNTKGIFNSSNQMQFSHLECLAKVMKIEGWQRRATEGWHDNGKVSGWRCRKGSGEGVGDGEIMVGRSGQRRAGWRMKLRKWEVEKRKGENEKCDG